MTVTAKTGTLQLRDQLGDYQFRGLVLEDTNFFSFMLDTYETFNIYKKENSVDNEERVAPTRGRPPHERIPYLEGARKGKSMRVRRAKGHETLPRFVGRWFPRNNDGKTQELYFASMLLLLSPWRSLQDLKDPMETFAESFERFTSTITHNSKIPQILENIQYYHDCYDAALAQPKEDNNPQLVDIDVAELHAELSQVDPEFETSIYSEHYTEEDIEAVRNSREADRERIYGEMAISLAKDAGIFERETENTNSRIADAIQPIARKADSAMLDNLRQWDDQLTTATRRQIKESGIVDLATIQPAEIQSEVGKKHPKNNTIKPRVATNMEERQRPLVAMLNTEQRRAHNIIEETLQKEISGDTSLLPKILGKRLIAMFKHRRQTTAATHDDSRLRWHW